MPSSQMHSPGSTFKRPSEQGPAYTEERRRYWEEYAATAPSSRPSPLLREDRDALQRRVEELEIQMKLLTQPKRIEWISSIVVLRR